MWYCKQVGDKALLLWHLILVHLLSNSNRAVIQVTNVHWASLSYLESNRIGLEEIWSPFGSATLISNISHLSYCYYQYEMFHITILIMCQHVTNGYPTLLNSVDIAWILPLYRQMCRSVRCSKHYYIFLHRVGQRLNEMKTHIIPHLSD